MAVAERGTCGSDPGRVECKDRGRGSSSPRFFEILFSTSSAAGGRQIEPPNGLNLGVVETPLVLEQADHVRGWRGVAAVAAKCRGWSARVHRRCAGARTSGTSETPDAAAVVPRHVIGVDRSHSYGVSTGPGVGFGNRRMVERGAGFVHKACVGIESVTFLIPGSPA